MRLHLPDAFPNVDLPTALVAETQVTTLQTGLSGCEVLVTLPNNYGVVLIHGRPTAYCDEHTVEAELVRIHRDTGIFTVAHDTGIRTDEPPAIQGWATGEWLSDTLSALAEL